MKFEYTDENKAKMDTVAEDLRGTCKGLDDGLQAVFGEDADLMDFDTELLRHLDDQVMLCEACGWWVETSDITDDANCIDCASNESDEDE